MGWYDRSSVSILALHVAMRSEPSSLHVSPQQQDPTARFVRRVSTAASHHGELDGPNVDLPFPSPPSLRTDTRIGLGMAHVQLPTRIVVVWFRFVRRVSFHRGPSVLSVFHRSLPRGLERVVHRDSKGCDVASSKTHRPPLEDSETKTPIRTVPHPPKRIRGRHCIPRRHMEFRDDLGRSLLPQRIWPVHRTCASACDVVKPAFFPIVSFRPLPSPF